MRLETAFLADFASSRDSLLNVVGGGITRIMGAVPGQPIPASLVMILEPNAGDVGRESFLHVLHVRLEGPEGQRVIEVDLKFKFSTAPVPFMEGSTLPFVMDLRRAPVLYAGRNRVRVTLEGGNECAFEYEIAFDPAIMSVEHEGPVASARTGRTKRDRRL